MARARKMQSIGDVLADIRTERIQGHFFAPSKVALPKDSKWQPGCVGRPDCKTCLGLGYLSPDLPTFHPKFGALVFCNCVSEEKKAQLTPIIEAFRRGER